MAKVKKVKVKMTASEFLRNEMEAVSYANHHGGKTPPMGWESKAKREAKDRARDEQRDLDRNGKTDNPAADPNAETKAVIPGQENLGKGLLNSIITNMFHAQNDIVGIGKAICGMVGTVMGYGKGDQENAALDKRDADKGPEAKLKKVEDDLAKQHAMPVPDNKNLTPEQQLDKMSERLKAQEGLIAEKAAAEKALDEKNEKLQGRVNDIKAQIQKLGDKLPESVRDQMNQSLSAIEKQIEASKPQPQPADGRASMREAGNGAAEKAADKALDKAAGKVEEKESPVKAGDTLSKEKAAEQKKEPVLTKDQAALLDKNLGDNAGKSINGETLASPKVELKDDKGNPISPPALTGKDAEKQKAREEARGLVLRKNGVSDTANDKPADPKQEMGMTKSGTSMATTLTDKRDPDGGIMSHKDWEEITPAGGPKQEGLKQIVDAPKQIEAKPRKLTSAELVAQRQAEGMANLDRGASAAVVKHETAMAEKEEKAKDAPAKEGPDKSSGPEI